MPIFRNAVTAIRQNMRTYIVLNIAVYGLFVLTMIVTAIFPDLQGAATARGNAQLDSVGPLAAAVSAYGSGNAVMAALLTFVVNLSIGALLTTTLPSLVVPFFGVGFMAYRVIEWGMTFAPIGPGSAALIPHSITLIVEAQGYIIATLGVIILWRSTFKPRTLGLTSRWDAYKSGLITNLRLYPLIIVILFAAAVYEAIEILFLVPLFH